MIVHINVSCDRCGEWRNRGTDEQLTLELPEDYAFNTHVAIEELEFVNRTLREEGWSERYVGPEGEEDLQNVCPECSTVTDQADLHAESFGDTR